MGFIEEGDSLIRLVFAECLHAAGEVDEAKQALGAAARRLRERGERISDKSWRQSFLENVPENARTLELARAWGVT